VTIIVPRNDAGNDYIVESIEIDGLLRGLSDSVGARNSVSGDTMVYSRLRSYAQENSPSRARERFIWDGAVMGVVIPTVGGGFATVTKLGNER